MSPRLSIVMVLYNSAADVAACIRSFEAELGSLRAELILVDNHSPDQSARLASAVAPSAQLISTSENKGFAAGANLGIAQASGPYVLLLNPDVEVPADGLQTLVAWMDTHPEIGAASPDLVGSDGRWESPGRAVPSVWRTVLELTRLHKLMPADRRAAILQGPYWLGGDHLDAGWVPGTAMIIRADAVRDVGVLREDFFMYGEDLEWCWRMKQSGWKIGVCSAASFVHKVSASAVLTWGNDERDRRVATGTYAACRLIYGSARARLLAVTMAGSFLAEAWTPGRAPEHRNSMLAAARMWRDLAARG